mgnify:FL=1
MTRITDIFYVLIANIGDFQFLNLDELLHTCIMDKKLEA